MSMNIELHFISTLKRIKRLIVFFFCITSILLSGSSCEKNNEENIEEEQKEEPIKDIGEVIKDSSFKKYCYNNFDLNKDGILAEEEVIKVDQIIIDFAEDIVSVEGVEIFQNLRSFSANQCSNLKEANMLNNVQLEYISFANCTLLNFVALPKSLKEIGRMDFYRCVGLTSINIPSNVTLIGDDAFEGCTGITTIQIPAAVTSIGNNAFRGCSNLTNIILNEGLQSIGEYTFLNCTNMRTITLPSTVKNIGECAFLQCTGLTTIYSKPIVPPTISGGTLMACVSLKQIRVPVSSVQAYKKASWWYQHRDKVYGDSSL